MASIVALVVLQWNGCQVFAFITCGAKAESDEIKFHSTPFDNLNEIICEGTEEMNEEEDDEELDEKQVPEIKDEEMDE